jgi:hypothetical protein
MVARVLMLGLQWSGQEEDLGGGEPVAALNCPCGQGHEIWGEVWWVGGKHEWVFFDDLKTSETRGEQLTHCPGCGRQLERRNLKAAGA